MDRAAGPKQSASSRRDVVRRGTIALAGLAGAGLGVFRLPLAAGAAGGQPSPTQDRAIFNFALLLEYLQAAFYTAAVKDAKLTGDVRAFAEVVSEHERAHVAYLRKALGKHARPRPNFDFGEATRSEPAFLKAAVLLENTGVLAYNGQAANLTKPALAAAAEIVSVEGRHAAWISALAGKPPAPRAADVGASSPEVVQELKSTGFLRIS
jgi:rubrerythrin